MERRLHLGQGFFLDIPQLTVLLANSCQRKKIFWREHSLVTGLGSLLPQEKVVCNLGSQFWPLQVLSPHGTTKIASHHLFGELMVWRWQSLLSPQQAFLNSAGAPAPALCAAHVLVAQKLCWREHPSLCHWGHPITGQTRPAGARQTSPLCRSKATRVSSRLGWFVPGLRVLDTHQRLSISLELLPLTLSWGAGEGRVG